MDRQITLPANLTGSALLPLLNTIAPPPRKTDQKSRFSPHFNWKSGATYAAAFVLVVALSALLGRGKPEVELKRGVIQPTADDPSASAVSPSLPSDAETESTPAFSADPVNPPASSEKQPDADVSGPAEDGDAAAVLSTPDPAEDPSSYIGGQSQSHLLTEVGSYTYSYRINDTTDPSKAGIPITASIVHTETDVLAFQIDFTDLTTIDECFVHENTVAFLGSTGGEGTALHMYDLSLLGEPQQMAALSHPGTLVAARLYKSVISFASFAPAGTDPSCPVTALPNSDGEDLCILSTLDMETLETRCEAFSGADNDVQLFNFNAYLQYSGQVTEDNALGHHVAHVRIDGVDMELRSEGDEDSTLEE